MDRRSGHGPQSGWRRTLKHLIPWALAAAIVAYVFSDVDLAALEAAFAEADLQTFGWVLGATGVAVWVLDALTIRVMVRRLLGPLTVWEGLTLRGVSYLFNALSYSLTAPAMAYYVKHQRGHSFLAGLSAFVWLNFVDIVALVVLLTCGWAVGLDLLPAHVASQVPWFVGGGWLLILGALAYWNLGMDFLVLGRLRGWRLFAAFRNATLAHYLEIGLWRLGLIVAYTGMTWLLLPTFQIEVPVGALMIYLPLLTFIQVIPASVSGLGAVQVVMTALLAPHVIGGATDPEAHVVAYSTAVGPALTILRLIIAIPLVALVSREVVPHQADIDRERLAEEDASDQGPEPPSPSGGEVAASPPDTSCSGRSDTKSAP